MNVYERIDKEVTAAPEATADEIAARVLRMCSKDDLAPLLAEAVMARQRARVRAAEQAKFAETIAELRERSGGTLLRLDDRKSAVERLAEMRSLLMQPISIGDGTLTTWGLATVEQHRQRVEMLSRHRAGISETIRRHEDAIALLETTAARCLAELVAPEERAA